jgi:nickel-dependent lactate racemase
MSTPQELRTAAWYGDRPLTLRFPPEWDVSVLWPDAPAPLTDAEIEEALERPVGHPPIRELAAGARRPVIIVDDLNRPTPADRVVPFLLRQLADAGIAAEDVRLVMATGTHGPPPPDGMAKKVGAAAAASCRLHVHDCRRDLVRLGATSHGTPVLVNREVAQGDLVIGLGGVYPNHTAGFGGGSKLILGVLGFRTIFRLHHGHKSVGWGAPGTGSSFRRDLDEIAKMVGLASTISVHVGPTREIVRVVSGDASLLAEEAMRFSSDRYTVRVPEDSDVVVVNAYPGDLSLTFIRMKSFAPLRLAPERASRVVVAACPEGLGFHGLFPFLNAPRFHRPRQIAMRLSSMPPGTVARKAVGKVRRRLPGAAERASESEAARRPSNRILLYRPIRDAPAHEFEIPGMRESFSWERILDGVRQEQGGRDDLRVALFACAPLQIPVGPSGTTPVEREGE